MLRGVTALYDTRAEAETALARLNADVSAQDGRIIAKGKEAELDTLKLSADDERSYREALAAGRVILVANVASSEDPDSIVAALEGPARDASRGSGGTLVEEQRIPVAEEELRIGKRQVERGGARVRSFVREAPEGEQVTLRQEHISVDTRPAERRLEVADVEAGGLLKERVIEITEMREEPVIRKQPVVREEVIVSKTVTERTETIRDTVRHTEVEVEDLGSRSEASQRDERRE